MRILFAESPKVATDPYYTYEDQDGKIMVMDPDKLTLTVTHENGKNEQHEIQEITLRILDTGIASFNLEDQDDRMICLVVGYRCDGKDEKQAFPFGNYNEAQFQKADDKLNHSGLERINDSEIEKVYRRKESKSDEIKDDSSNAMQQGAPRKLRKRRICFHQHETRGVDFVPPKSSRRLAITDSMTDNIFSFVCFVPLLILLVLMFKRFSQSCSKNDEENNDQDDAEIHEN